MQRNNLIFILLCFKLWMLKSLAASLSEDVEILIQKMEKLERQMAQVLKNMQEVNASGRWTGASQCQCPSNYTWHTPLKLCFRLSKETQTWEAARQICESEGGHLAKVDTTEIQLYLKEQIVNSRYIPKRSHVFIGGSDKEEEGIWRWADRELVVMNSSIWIPGEPNSKETENCLLLWGHYNYLVGDFDCSQRLYYVCQFG